MMSSVLPVAEPATDRVVSKAGVTAAPTPVESATPAKVEELIQQGTPRLPLPLILPRKFSSGLWSRDDSCVGGVTAANESFELPVPPFRVMMRRMTMHVAAHYFTRLSTVSDLTLHAP